MSTFDYLNEYYSQYDEQNRLGSRHGQVEFLTTMRYVEKFLRTGMRVLEVGAGTGRYSHALARMGYAVTAVELIPHNIELLNAATEPDEDLTVFQGNALELSMLEDESYDMTLVLGPMYHLYERADQTKAISEALRVTKRGGYACFAYCVSDASIVQYGFVSGNIFELLRKEMVNPDTFETKSNPVDLFQLYRKEHIDALMAGFATRRLHYAATDLFTPFIGGAVDAMDDVMFEMYLKYHFAVCERADLVGMPNHSLDVHMKE